MTNQEYIETQHATCEDCEWYGSKCHCQYEDYDHAIAGLTDDQIRIAELENQIEVLNHFHQNDSMINDHDDDSIYLWGHATQYRAGFKDGILTALDLLTRCHQTPQEIRAYLTSLVNQWNRKD